MDIGPLSWVKSEIDSSLERARGSFKAFAAAPLDGKALKSAQTHLHQAYGAVQIVGLNGVSRFFEETECLVADIESGRVAAGPAVFDVLDRATQAIGKYLSELLDGVPDQPLRLYPLYREMALLRGIKDVSEADLFFPDLSLQAPPREDAPVRLSAEDTATYLRGQRTRYQRGFLKWLKEPQDRASIADMQAAVDGIESIQIVPAQRSFWWAAGAFCQALANGALAPGPGVKQLASKLEQMMRTMTGGTSDVPERLMREVLYWLARTEASDLTESGRVGAARQAFRLDDALPSSAPEIDQSQRVPAAMALREKLGSAKDGTVSPPPIDDMTGRAQQKLAVERAVAEMQAGLRQIEQGLDAYFRDAARGSELAALEPAIGRVAEALERLGETAAGTALERCKVKIRAFAQAASRPDQREFEEVAQILSGLGFHVEALRHGKPEFSAVMHPARANAATGAVAEKVENVILEEIVAPVVDISPPTEAPSTGAKSLKDAAGEVIDQELLVVFLEEAVGVLDSIARSLEASRAHPSDAAELTTIRRGFHTLKGSGRMVGLVRLGDAASAVEQVLNRWEDEKRAASPALFELVEFAYNVFSDWVSRLQRGEPLPDPQPVIDRAEEIGRSAPEHSALPPLAPPALERPAHAEPPAETPVPGDGVRIGGLEISASLFAVFSNEARHHLETIERELAQAAAGRTAGVRDELVRAAHTLAGICGTVQLKGMHHLSVALEGALLRLKQRLASIAPADLALVHDSVQALKMMYEGVLERAAPGSADSLIARLGAVTGESAGLTGAPEEVPVVVGAVAPDSAMAAGESPSEEPSISETTMSELAMAELEGAGLETPAPPVVPAGTSEDRRQRRLRDEIDPQLLPVFVDEANELVPMIGQLLRTWRSEPANFDTAHAMQRALHTLKGSARMAGAMALGELTHRMETQVENAIALRLTPGQFFDDLETSYDRMGLLLERAQHPDIEGPPDEAIVAADAPTPENPAAPAAAVLLEGGARLQSMMRVRADALEKLVIAAGEIAIARTRVETEMRGLKNALVELTENVTRLRRELREIEIAAESQLASRMHASQDKDKQFDPLEFDRYTRFQELARMMAESVNDVSTVQQTLNKVADDTDLALAAQARLNRELQQDLMRIRMVPVGSIVDRLHRIVRQTSKEAGKRANLEVRGANVEVDRSALERITGPLEHLLRNAITHGLEAPETRVAKGKPAMGEISLEARQEGNEVTLVLADDGDGLDLERIRAKAVALGLLGTGEVRSDQQLAEFVFAPGFSTADSVTEIAGRGIGLDVVMSEVRGLGGRIELAFTPGTGTRFTIRLPLTTAIIQALLVRVGSHTYGLPSVMVEQVQQIRQELLVKAREAGAIEWTGRHYPLHRLSTLLGIAVAVPAAPRRHTPVLLVRSGAEGIAIEVDEMIGNQEMVVKNIGPQLARVPGIAGATILGTGEIVLILNPVPLAARTLSSREVVAGPGAHGPAVPAQPRILVVDDSLTVRKVTGRLLSREGYAVSTARDGVEALELLAETVPDVLLVDVEMPRMDGFDLTRNVRADPRLKAVPIIMITSRTADKHRNFALALGVNVFLGKPYREDELLAHIAGFVARS